MNLVCLQTHHAVHHDLLAATMHCHSYTSQGGSHDVQAWLSGRNAQSLSVQFPAGSYAVSVALQVAPA